LAEVMDAWSQALAVRDAPSQRVAPPALLCSCGRPEVSGTWV